MTARNHHFIPQCYLKAFARNSSKNSKLLAIDLESKTAFGTSPKNVAVRRDFNRVDLDGLPIDVLEQDYAKLEGRVAAALRAIEETERFDDIAHLSSIVNLIAILAVRTPKGRESRRRIAERVIKDSFRKNTASREAYDAHEELTREQRQAANIPNVPYEIIRAYVDDDQYSIELSTMHHIEQELPMYREIFPYLRDRQWRLWIAPADSGGFVTSDHPVGIVWQESPPDGRTRPYPSRFQKPWPSAGISTLRVAPTSHRANRSQTSIQSQSASQIARCIPKTSDLNTCGTDESRGTAGAVS
jgi:hypothetical protein